MQKPVTPALHIVESTGRRPPQIALWKTDPKQEWYILSDKTLLKLSDKANAKQNGFLVNQRLD